MTLAPVSISDELDSQFKAACEGMKSNVGHWFHVQIKDEEIRIVRSKEGSGNLASDYQSMSASASDDEAAYFIIRVGKATHWLIVTYVPESVGVKEKMVYASAKGSLKDKLGHQNFEDDVHATEKSELSYDAYKGARNPSDSRSEFEKQHAEVLEQEEAARSEATTAHTSSVEGIGGYHSVTVPLSDQAKRDINRLKSGEINFIALTMADDKSSIDASAARMIGSASLSKEMHSTEPRFYLFTPTSKAPVFIYCCPERSAPKSRMVYSTSKNSVADAIAKLGINLAPKRLEVTDPAEIDDELKSAHSVSSGKVGSVASKMSGMSLGGMGRPMGMTGRMGPGAVEAPEMGGQVKASKTSRVEAEHPIYSLINQGKSGEGSTHKKKIVIPPRAAYYG